MPRRYLALALAGLGLWAAVAVWIAPQLIRAGYSGESVALINGVFAGRDVHPVEFYLDDWRSLARDATWAMLGGLAVVFLGIRFSGVRQRLIRWVVGGPPSLDLRAFIWYAFLLSFLGGGSQATYAAIRQFVVQAPTSDFRWEYFWMMPVSASLVGLCLAMPLAALARAGDTRVGVWKATLLFGFFVIYAVMQSDGIPLDPRAEFVLALGLSTVVARAVTRRAEALARLVDRLPRLMLGACGVLVFLLVINLPAVAERLAARSRGAVSGDRPNVLLVVLDTVRASQLSLYGYHRPTTPHLDEWAKTGVVFERAFSTAPWTLPAHATMFTGGYHFETRTGPNQPLDRSRPTLAEILTEHGYATAGFVANLGYTTPMSGLHRGFARYEAHRLSLSSVFGSSWLGSGLLDLVGIEDDQGWKTAENVTAELLGWLGRRENDRPFFAFLNYFDAHARYDSPEPYHSMFGPAAAGGALSNLNYQWSRFGYQWAQTPDNPSTRQQLALWMNQYDGAVAYIDHQLGVVHDALAARGLLDNTLVVVTADHGEHWGEHALAEHGNALYVPSLQVPLLISLPGVVQANQRVVRPVTLRDLPATMLALVGLRDEAALPGTPLLSLSGGSGPGPGSTILAELDRKPWHLAGPGRVPVERGDMKALFDGDLHYILNGDGIEELYDVVLDPEELDDLSENPEYGAALSRFRSTLRTMGTARQDQF